MKTYTETFFKGIGNLKQKRRFEFYYSSHLGMYHCLNGTIPSMEMLHIRQLPNEETLKNPNRDLPS